MADKPSDNMQGGVRRLARLVVPALLVALSGCSGLRWASETNLFVNPSFEQLADRSGRPFEGWGGWVHQAPARISVGNVARSGAHSVEIGADRGGKARLLSEKMALAAGRYRVTVHLRGLDVAPGGVDFSLGYDGRFHVLKLAGSFGWTPVEQTFELDRGVDNFQLMVGLHDGGWLWIDDVALERVGDEGVSSSPRLGAEEGGIVPPGPLAADADHCPECGYRNNRDWPRCFACGHELDRGPHRALPRFKVIADFEDGGSGPVKGGRIVTEHAPQGRYALAAEETVSISRPQDWSGYQLFRLDVYNPSAAPRPLLVEVRDAQSKGYWTRVNFETMVPPGTSTVTLPTDMYVGEKSRPGRRLVPEAVTALFLDPKGNRLVFDNLRLERVDADEVLFPGLSAFSFGPADAPLMEGFRRVTAAMRYQPGRGFGWQQAALWRSANVRQPDALYQSFICPRSGSFRVDLPDGRYRVIMNIDSPNGYWGEVPAYTRRRVLANGYPVVDERLDLEGFEKRYYRNADREDLPGLDPFDDYVQRMFRVREFEVAVSGGRLELGFEGEGYAIALSGLVIYPAERATEGKRFWNWITGRRRAQFNDYFRQVRPEATGQTAPVDGFALFSRPFMQPVNAYDGPLAGEALPPFGLRVQAAGGEEVPVTFSVQPSAAVGELRVEVGGLSPAGGEGRPGGRLPMPEIVPGWLDYRIGRRTADGSVYTVAPRYWHPLPAPQAPGVTRTFWLRVKVPAGAAAGPYQATVRVKPARGRARSFPVTIEVLPFTLDRIGDVAVGPWGSSINLPWLARDPGKAARDRTMFAKSLRVLHEAGCTSFSWTPPLKAAARRGLVRLDSAAADDDMALIRASGFDGMIVAYGGDGLGYRMYGDGRGADRDAAAAAGFRDPEAFLKALYASVDRHAVLLDWLPVAWNICDEPSGEEVRGAALNALAHRQAARGLRLTTFTGATSLVGDDPDDPHLALARTLPVPSLNRHDRRSLQAIVAAGNRPAIYNNGNRWTFGRYLKMLVVRQQLALRLAWHFNATAGDPYYALDCREDDYCWFNSNARMDLVPSVTFLADILPGLNDYRYLTTLQRLLRERPDHPAAAAARKVFEAMIDLEPGRDLARPDGSVRYEADRSAVAAAITALSAPP